MKNLFAIVLVFCLTVLADAGLSQNVYIPDSNFRAFLQSEYPSCMDGDNLNSQCSDVVEESALIISNAGITNLTGVEAFVNLDTLWCWGNELGTLPELPPSLLSLSCGYAQLTELPNLPVTLQELDCSNNELQQLPSLPESLLYLSSSHNPITSLPSLPGQLIGLGCGACELTELPELPDSLEVLAVASNQLTHLPDLPSSLTNLECHRQNLVELPELPQGLIRLVCWWNQLTQLPALPPNLEYLSCKRNQISSLPELPNSLLVLGARENQLQVLPPLPPNLQELEVDLNNLVCLPYLPESLEHLFFDQTIECIPNIPASLPWNFALPLQEMPICSENNTHHCSHLSKVSGRVFVDADENCEESNSEVGLRNRVIVTGNNRFAISNLNGDYSLFLDSGLHILNQSTTIPSWNVDCSGIPYQLFVDSFEVDSIHFPNQPVVDCHWLWVDINSSNQRPCFTTNSFAVSYCNYGTESVSDAYVELTFPPQIIPQNSSIPWQDLGNGVYRFDIGSLGIDECGSFNVSDSVSCDAVVGSTACVTAEIFPISPCLIATAQAGWDNSSISVDGTCNGENIDFTIENTGVGDMTASANYRLFQNNALLEEGQLAPLPSNGSTSISQLADGATYRLEVDQSLGHPGYSLPRATVEGCGSPVVFGQVNTVAQDDYDDHIEIVCTELTAAYDPNDKRVVPAGYGSDHLIHPNDSLLEYTIRFQNTGSDTAFTVEVVDSLPTEYLNPITFLSGASSHPYTVRMHGNGIVIWRFENILLPDSTTDLAGSQGFVTFKIRTRPGLGNGTVINNRAHIYFDFNAAIITETCFVTISDEPIIASNAEIAIDDKVNIYPNPTNRLVNIEIQDSDLEVQTIRLYDITGRVVAEGPFRNQIDVSKLNSGNYIIALYTSKGVYRQKLIVN